MTKEQFEYAKTRFGTPMYLFDTDVFQEQIRSIRRILGEDTGICYAMKANPFLAARAFQEVDRIEVCSKGEFRICREMEIPPEKLIISGVLKKKEDLYEILNYCGGKSVYTAESWNQFRLLANWCDASSDQLRVFPRLSSGNQFGVDKRTLDKIFTVKALYPNLKIQGIHYFSGTQKKSASRMRAELEMLEEYFCRLEEDGIHIEELEYGDGGRFTGISESDSADESETKSDSGNGQGICCFLRLVSDFGTGHKRNGRQKLLHCRWRHASVELRRSDSRDVSAQNSGQLSKVCGKQKMQGIYGCEGMGRVRGSVHR